MLKGFSTMKNCFYPILFLCLSLIGCKKFSEIDITVVNENLMFSPSSLKKNTDYQLHELSIYKKDCDDDCIMWRISYNINNPINQRFINLTNGEIFYGQVFTNSDIDVPAKKLTSGIYNLSGSISTHNNQASLFSKDFILKINENGTINVTPL